MARKPELPKKGTLAEFSAALEPHGISLVWESRFGHFNTSLSMLITDIGAILHCTQEGDYDTAIWELSESYQSEEVKH